MYDPEVMARYWAYGWLNHDSVPLNGASSDLALIEQYVASPAFHHSFLPPYEIEGSGLHGPFRADLIHAEDFVAIQEPDLVGYLESLFTPDDPEDVAERANVLPHLLQAFAGDRRCYVLRRDERDKNLFHDWGFVFDTFREFLFVDSDRQSLDRFLIGVD